VRPAIRVRDALRARLDALDEARRHPRRRGWSPRPPTGNRVLVTGWFSWSDGAATAGDLLARDVACRWLDDAGRDFDVANAPAFGGGVDWRRVDPTRYSDVVFVCGPVEAGRRLDYLLQQFGGSRWTGLDVTMLRPLDTWNPFDVLIERDSSATARPDLAFVAQSDSLPLVGVVLVEPYWPEYPERDRQPQAREAVSRLLASRPAVRVPIDTRLPVNETGLRSAAEIQSAIARMDVVVTTRLHGLVLALKHGVPALALDPVEGGAKITQQACAVGWPMVLSSGEFRDDQLATAFDFCLGQEGRQLAAECAARARTALEGARRQFVDSFGLQRSGGNLTGGDQLQDQSDDTADPARRVGDDTTDELRIKHPKYRHDTKGN
jgi:Polysaccharide pyruvyl transferase